MAADPLGWLPFRSRSRTPVPRSPTKSERASGFDADDHRDYRRPGPSRMSSYLSLNTASISPEPLTPASVPPSTPSLMVKEEDRVWHNPSLHQMVEALRVIMMTKGALAPVPIEHNSYILHLIEGFSDMQEQLQAANAARQESEKAQKQLLEDFWTVADEWSRREALFKKEIKRLEVLLAHHSSDGVETVTLARKNSVVDRKADAEQFVRGVQRLRRQSVLQHNSQSGAHNDYPVFLGNNPSTHANLMKCLQQIDRENESLAHDGLRSPRADNLPAILDRNNDFLVSEDFRQKDTTRPSTLHHRRRRPRHQNSRLLQENSPTDTTPTGLPLHTVREEPLSVLSTSSSSLDDLDVTPRSISAEVNLKGQQQQQRHLDGGVHENSPELKTPKSNAKRQAEASQSLQNSPRARQSGRFSFVPGDDTFGVTAYRDPENGMMSTDEALKEARRPRIDPDLHSNKTLPRRRSDNDFAHQPPGQLSCPLETSEGTDGAKTPTSLSGRRPRGDYRSKGGSKHVLGSQSRESMDAAAQDGANVPVGLEDNSPESFGMRYHDSASSGKMTVIRDASIRSNQSPGSVSESKAAQQSHVSPSADTKRRPSQRQSSAQIAAARAVARNKRGKSDTSKG